MLCGDMHGAPYDLLASFLVVPPARLRGIVARWRRARYAATGRLGPGPTWCWLTRSELAVTGQHHAPGKPALGRLGHIRAVSVARRPHPARPVPLTAAQGLSLGASRAPVS
jgi:hypothetical protein